MSQIVSETDEKVKSIRQYRLEGEGATYVRGMYDEMARAELRLPTGEYCFTISPREIRHLLQEFPVERVHDLFK